MPGGDYLWKSMFDLGLTSLKKGDIFDAEHCFGTALEQAKKAGFKSIDERYRQTLEEYVSALMVQSRFHDAEKYAVELNNIEACCLKPDDLQVAKTKGMLGALYLGQKNYIKAKEFYSMALPILIKHHGKEHADVEKIVESLKTVLNNAAVGYEQKREFAASQKFADEIQALFAITLGEDHEHAQDINQTFNKLMSRGKESMAQELNQAWEEFFRDAVYLEGQGRFDEANDLYGHAVEVAQKLGKDDKRLAETLDHRGMLYLREGKVPEADTQFRQALLAYFLSDPTSMNVSRILGILCVISLEKNNVNPAEELAWSALEIALRADSAESMELGQLLQYMGEVYMRQRKPDQAAWLFTKSLQILQAKLSDDATDVREAKTRLEGALAAITSESNEHPVAFAYKGLVRLNQGQLQKASEDFETAAKLWQQERFEAHPNVTRTLKLLAEIEIQKENMERAGEIYSKILGLFKEKQPIGFQHVLCLKAYAKLLRQTNRVEVAQELESRAAQIDPTEYSVDSNTASNFRGY